MTAHVLLATDFDGTAASIDPRTGLPQWHRDAWTLIGALAGAGNVAIAVVSGRESRDLAAWTSDLCCYRAASYGAEVAGPDGTWLRLRPKLGAAMPVSLRSRIEATTLFLDEKSHGIAIHWPSSAARRRHIKVLNEFRTWSASESLRLIEGFNLLEAVAHEDDKAAAVRLIAAEENAHTIIYAGNDRSDATALQWACGCGMGFLVSSDDALPTPDPRCKRVQTMEALWRCIGDTLAVPWGYLRDDNGRQ